MAFKNQITHWRSERQKQVLNVKISLPCIGKDEPLDQPSALGKAPNGSHTCLHRTNSEPDALRSAGRHGNVSAKRDIVDNTERKRSCHKDRRRCSVPVGRLKRKVSVQPSKVRKVSKSNARTASPDVIDLCNRDDAQELLLRLFDALAVSGHNSAIGESNVEEHQSIESKPNSTNTNHCYWGKDDRNTPIRLPKVKNSTSSFQVFYTKPVSLNGLKNERSQETEKIKHFVDFHKPAMKPFGTSHRNEKKGNYLRLPLNNGLIACDTASRDRYSAAATRQFSVPIIKMNSSCFISSKTGERSFTSEAICHARR